MIAGNIIESNQVLQHTTRMLAQRHDICLQIMIDLTLWNRSRVSQNSESKLSFFGYFISRLGQTVLYAVDEPALDLHVEVPSPSDLFVFLL
jgi:hypothetical protein